MMLLKRKFDQTVPVNHNTNAPVKTDMMLVPPIRQTASIFKQSVTIIKAAESKVEPEMNYGTQDKPKQVFWEKRLQGLSACDKNEQTIEGIELPRKIKAVGLELNDDTLLRSIATALHLNNHAITGQNRPRTLLDKSPGVYINPTQPLVLGLHVTDEDILEQEKRVEEARQKLQEVMNERHN